MPSDTLWIIAEISSLIDFIDVDTFRYDGLITRSNGRYFSSSKMFAS